MRVNKFLAQIGIGSRRKVDELINTGEILINDESARLGQELRAGDLILYKDQEFEFKAQELEKFYYGFNKPIGVICTCAEDEEQNIISYLHEHHPELKEQRLFPVGRLDKNSRGLLILTNDGDLSQKLTHPKFEHEKEYQVTCKEPLAPDFIKNFQAGVEIFREDKGDKVVTKACKAKKLGASKFSCVLEQGHKRQIRLMVNALNNEVLDLYRTRIAGLKIERLGANELIKLEYGDIQCLDAN
ncbi:MAG: pseudouridine synthase [Candidatus Melainabacteria bacterium]|nr:pseudouridine synthase [Candidatus Melainabacteria bacterium]